MVTVFSYSKTKGSCKSYVDTCHTSDKGKGRGSPALANAPAQRPQSSKKGSSPAPSQTQKKPKVSLYYSKYKNSSTPAAAINMDEEQEELTPDSPCTSEPDLCNSEPAFISELENKADSHSTTEDRAPAVVLFPMEIPAGFPEDVTLTPGPRPGLLMCTPSVQSCTQQYDKMEAIKRDSSEQEVRGGLQHVLQLLTVKTKVIICLFVFDMQLREDETGQTKKVQSAETGTAPGNKGKRSRKKTESGSW